MNAQKHVILFNGPPRSGKDTAADIAIDYFQNLHCQVSRYSVAHPLKKAVHALFGLNVPVDEYEDRKSTPLPEFFGSTPRQAYIDLSEKFAKPHYTPDFFAKVAVQYIKNLPNSVIVVSDCGFKAELNAIIQEFGEENVRLVRIYRPGTSFGNGFNGLMERIRYYVLRLLGKKPNKPVKDSRSYLHSENSIEIQNDGDIHDLSHRIEYMCAKLTNDWGLV